MGLRTQIRRLPRDARDTLFVLFVIGLTVLPHVPNLPPWCGLFAAALLLWRARLAVNNAPLPARGWLVLALAVAGLLTFWSHRTLIGKEAGITMAVVLMALKTLELRARRDAIVVFFLGFFLVLTHFLYSQSLFAAASMVIVVWGLLAALALAHMPAGRPSLKVPLRVAARAALLGAPIMALLFVLFPRIGPLWGAPQETAAKTGLSGTMQLGGVAEIANDDSIAFRAHFPEGQVPPPEALYWRGPVLSRFDGREWRAPPPFRLRDAPPPDELRTSGLPLPYQLTLEPSRLPMLPLLEATVGEVKIEGDAPGLQPRLRSDLTWVVQRPLVERVRLSAVAYPRFRLGPMRATMTVHEDLDLPSGYNPRTLAWAAQLKADPRYARADARTLAAALHRHIATGGFSYTLAPGIYGENDPRAILDEFWLDRKAGFCEHFAAAFVVVMRALGVPARVVTGYQGSDPFPVDGWIVVRQSHAHAWAEYYQEGIGWVRGDPTSAVAPDRIQRSVHLAPQPGLVAGALGAISPTLVADIRAVWEAVNNRWNQWVLNYSRGDQLSLVERLGIGTPSWEDLALLLLGAFSVLALLGALWAWWDRQRQDPWTRLNLRVRRLLASEFGIDAPPHATLRALAATLREREGGDAAARWLIDLDEARYGRQALKRPPRNAWVAFLRTLRKLQSA